MSVLGNTVYMQEIDMTDAGAEDFAEVRSNVGLLGDKRLEMENEQVSLNDR